MISSTNCIPFQACRILLSYGCDTTIVSLQGYTAAQLATESVAKILAEEPVHQAGADIEYQLRLELVDIQTAAKQYTDAAATFDWLLAAKPDLLSNKDFMKIVNKNKKKAGIA